jgi:hypothetical protein
MNVNVKKLKEAQKEPCRICMAAKQTHQPYHCSSKSLAVRPLQLVHTDLMGPLSPTSAGLAVYAMTVIDDHSGYAAVIMLKNKTQASEELQKIIRRWERQLGPKVQQVRCDRGTEYHTFHKMCEAEGIGVQRTVAYSPEQNGRAERFNRMEGVRTM